MVGLSTADDVEAVVAAVRVAREHGPVVLVGHSRGGLAVTAAVNAVPDLLAHVVHVAAWSSSRALDGPLVFCKSSPRTQDPNARRAR
jgi:pimeloyl-ACP methyl ester carboxylesterase